VRTKVRFRETRALPEIGNALSFHSVERRLSNSADG
jgi:hypothetical protein